MDWSKILGEKEFDLMALVSIPTLLRIAGIILSLALILISFKILQLLVLRFTKTKTSVAQKSMIRKLFRYTSWTIAVMTVLSFVGIDLRALLGAAGIAGVAIGFAAQTSVSNIISGLFLASEKHFSIGDGVQIGDVLGIVESTGLLSVKIQTYDNRYIRIPNETLIKSNVINVTRFPIRRFDVKFSVSYDSDLAMVREILADIARKNVWALDNPEPLILIDAFSDSGINFVFGVWFEKDNYMVLKNSMMIDIHTRFNAEHISIPFPQMDVHVANALPPEGFKPVVN